MTCIESYRNTVEACSSVGFTIRARDGQYGALGFHYMCGLIPVKTKHNENSHIMKLFLHLFYGDAFHNWSLNTFKW